jgi:hypothetical protein
MKKLNKKKKNKQKSISLFTVDCAVHSQRHKNSKKAKRKKIKGINR